MMRKVLPSVPSNLTAARNLPIFRRRINLTFLSTARRFFSDGEASSSSPSQTRLSELPRVDSIVHGCDYKHWLVVMQPPDNYPQREEIVQQYVATLTMALGRYVYKFEMNCILIGIASEIGCGKTVLLMLHLEKYTSEEAARESMYSVSTKYYYAFSCKVTETVTHKIKSLPRVKWVLPDSYLCTEDSTGYGGEPFIDGKVVPYEEKYHTDWLRHVCDEDSMERTHSRKPTRRRRGSRNSRATSN